LEPVWVGRVKAVLFQPLSDVILEQMLDDKAGIPDCTNPDKSKLILKLDSLVVSIPILDSLVQMDEISGKDV